jgi:hypothetical protein
MVKVKEEKKISERKKRNRNKKTFSQLNWTTAEHCIKTNEVSIRFETHNSQSFKSSAGPLQRQSIELHEKRSQVTHDTSTSEDVSNTKCAERANTRGGDLNARN